MLRLNIELISQTRSEKVTHSLVIETVDAVDAGVQLFAHDPVNRLRKGLE